VSLLREKGERSDGAGERGSSPLSLEIEDPSREEPRGRGDKK